MEGLDKFKEAFADYSDNYVIIGGTACEMTLANSDVRPRATHDIDMIVIVENMTAEFGMRFWEFISEGGYRPERHRVADDELPKYEMYRFVDGKFGYPVMIELLSRHPDILGVPKGLTIEPIPIGQNVSSLSAIIMDDDFYHFTIDNSILTDGIRHASPIALIALKARAYLNLLNDKANGIHVNTKHIKKHRSDILKNAVVVSASPVKCTTTIVNCVQDFIVSIRKDFNQLGLPLAKSLDVDVEVIEALLSHLSELFIEKR